MNIKVNFPDGSNKVVSYFKRIPLLDNDYGIPYKDTSVMKVVEISEDGTEIWVKHSPDWKFGLLYL